MADRPPLPEGTTASGAARVEVANQLRRVFHALADLDHDAHDLKTIGIKVAEIADQMELAPKRHKELAAWKSVLEANLPDDGDSFADSLDRPVSGSANAWSVPLHVRRQGDKVTTTVELGPGFEGAPGRSHGGFVCAIYDDLCGFVLNLEQQMAFTAYLNVSFLAATPLHVPITFSAWLDRRQDRKLYIVGECRQGSELLTTVDSLFIALEGSASNALEAPASNAPASDAGP